MNNCQTKQKIYTPIHRTVNLFGNDCILSLSLEIDLKNKIPLLLLTKFCIIVAILL